MFTMVTSAMAQDIPSSSPSGTLQSTLLAVEVTAPADRYEKPASRTATRTNTPSLLTAQSIQIVPRTLIDDQAALTLDDAVRNVSGVQYDFGFNGAMQPLLILRGFPNTSMTASGSMSGSSSYYLDGSKVMGVPIDMANVQSVEVVKGPGSVLYGRSEPGGLVNVVTKQISSVSERSFEQTVGQRGMARTAIAASGMLSRNEAMRGRIAAAYYTANSIRDGVVDRLGSFTGSLAWVPNLDTNITAIVDHSRNRYRTDMGIPAFGDRPARLPWSRQYNDSPYLSSANTTSVKVDVTRQLDESWQVRSRLLHLDSHTSEMDIYPYRGDFGMGTRPSETCPGSGTPMCRYYFGVRPDGRYRISHANIDLTGKSQTGAISHTVLIGIDTYRTGKTGATYMEQIESVDVFHPSPGDTRGLDIRSASTDGEDYSHWRSGYVQDQIALGQRVFVTAALRRDRTNAVFGGASTRPNRIIHDTSPRCGMAVRTR
ncbi:hypothetical protein Xmlh_16000 [Xanthomonas axonopodis pv. melhusii]|uniref:TonB-dependent receptor plug domain-containing protein n=1 Tax=Xanthomonas axonopodis pv. melhusii TaxID=487834 RepID=A0A1T1NWT5_9XANT|nr:TonB-dependent receptor [Xanthomonas axonopodis]OOW67814.1 hypothetical protein Xmlh_16000 [Xanthomonas axonopodis pv. melhusii]